MSRMFVNGKVSVDYENKRLCDVACFSTAQGKFIGMHCFFESKCSCCFTLYTSAVQEYGHRSSSSYVPSRLQLTRAVRYRTCASILPDVSEHCKGSLVALERVQIRIRQLQHARYHLHTKVTGQHIQNDPYKVPFRTVVSSYMECYCIHHLRRTCCVQ